MAENHDDNLRTLYAAKEPQRRLDDAIERATETMRVWFGGELPDRLRETPTADSKTARHSIDFASVNWFGTLYQFTGNQAACVKVLWEARKNGTPILMEATIQEVAEMTSPLRGLFRDHPAWGAMIVPAGKGQFRLAGPTG